MQGNIAFNKLAAPGEALFSASEFNANELTALSQAGIVFGPKSGNNFFDLEKGFVLFMPSHDIQVQTREGTVYIPKGYICDFSIAHGIANVPAIKSLLVSKEGSPQDNKKCCYFS